MKIPNSIRLKIFQLNRYAHKMEKTEKEIIEWFESKGIEADLLYGNANVRANKQTEELSFIVNAEIKEEDINESIDEIERIYNMHTDNK